MRSLHSQLFVFAMATTSFRFEGSGPCPKSSRYAGSARRWGAIALFAVTGWLALATPASAQQLQFVPSLVQLFAGTGVQCSDTGDGGPASAATLCNVTSVAVDQVGNTYIVDSAENTVRKVDINGNISAFAGVPVHAGFNSSSGDGGPATAAYIDVPTDVAVDPSGNVYIVESFNDRIREVNVSTGIITTFVGGAPGNFKGGTGSGVALGEPIGLAFDPAGNLYIGTFGQYVVIKVTPAGVATALAGTGTAGYNGDNIQATSAELSNPLEVASDLAGNIYIEDGNSNNFNDCRIRKVTVATGIITTVAGTGACASTGDGGPATSAAIYTNFGPFTLDAAGDIFFNTIDTGGNGSSIRKVDVEGNISTVVGGGTTEPSTSGYPVSSNVVEFPGINAARLNNSGNLVMPVGPGMNSNYTDEIAVAGASGSLQFGDETVGSTSSALTVTLEDTSATTLSLSQTTYSATGDFAVSGGTCIGLSSLTSGATCTISATFTPTTTGTRTGNISVASNSSIGTQTVVLNGNGTPPTTPTATLTPTSVAFGNQTVNTTSTAQTLTLSNISTVAVTGVTVSLTGANPTDFATTTTCGSTLAASSTCTISVTFTPGSAASFGATVSVADNAGSSPQTSTLIGTGVTQYGPPTSGSFAALTFVPATLDLIAGLNGMGYAGDGGLANSATTKFNYPTGLAYDSAGDLFITDQSNYVVRRIDHTTGDISTFAGNNTFGSTVPAANTQATSFSIGLVTGLAVDAGNNVYFADRSNHVIWKVDTTGVITVFAGTVGTPGYTGDGTAATAATLDGPWGIAFDATGNLYIADTGNRVIRRVDTAGNIHTFAGDGADAGSFSCPSAYSGDGGPATSAEFCGLYGVTADPSGNVYIADYEFSVVKVVHTDGTIHAFAGDGTKTVGDTGDGGPATAANLYTPYGLYADPAGNIYIVDQGGNTIREVNTSGVIQTVFGVYSGGLSKSSIGEPDNEEVTVAVGPADGIYFITMDKFGDLVEVDSSGETVTSAGSVGQYVFGETTPYTTTAPAYVTLLNPSAVALTFSGTPTVTGDYNIVTGTGAGTCNLAGSLAAGASCTIGITFSPTSGDLPGIRLTGSIVLTSNSNSSPNTINLSGIGYGSPTYVATLTGPANSYSSDVNVTSASQAVTLKNTGSPPVTISSTDFTSAGADGFAVSSTTCPTSPATLASGASCVFNIDFTPPAATTYTDQFQVAVANYGTLNATLSGTGVANSAPTLTPSTLTFPPVALGSGDDSMYATLTNTGSTELTGITVTYTGTDPTDFFTYPSGTCGTTLAANSSCTIAVRFTPAGTGTRTATLNVAQSGTTQALTSALSGIGLVAPTAVIQFYPAQLNYVAGNGMHPAQCNDTGDNGPATSAELCQPYGAAMDAAGNTYMVDYADNVVKKIDTTGIITTFAGVEGLAGGYSGDGGPATSALLSNPVAIAFDANNNAYISDSGNGRIREVHASIGNITTFVGGGPGTYFNPGTSGTEVALLQPGGIAFDSSGNLYIAVDGQQIVAEVTPAGVASVYAGVLTQAGPGKAGYNGDNIAANTAELNGPQQVAVDRLGNVYIADTGNNRIREVDATTGIISTVAGNGTLGYTGDGGLATSAEIGAEGVAVDLAGNVYLSDNSSSTVRKVNVDTGDILTVAGSGTGPVGGAANLAAISVALPAVDNFGNVLVPDGESGQAALLSEGSTGFLQFGSETVGSTTAALTATIYQVGDAELDFNGAFTVSGDFAVTGGSCLTSEGPGTGGCTVTVTFTPTATGTRTGSIVVPSNSVGGGSNSILLNGTGVAASTPTATLTPTSIAFGNQTVSTTSTAQTLTLSNTSSVELTGITISLTGTDPTDFATTTTCGTTLAASSTCTISVTFTPASTSSYSATVSVADNAGSSPQTSALTGTGTAATTLSATLTPSSVAFGNQTVNTTSTAQTLTLKNTGNTTLTGITVSLTGTNPADFSYTTTCGATLTAASTCTISVTFTPTSVASFGATISVADNATVSPQSSTLTGTGTAVPAPIATLSPATVSFPVTNVGTTTAAQTLTLSNTGNAALAISSVSIAGTNPTEFADTSACGSSLAAGSSCTISVTFTPDAVSSFSATLTVTDNAASSPQTSTLSGSGQPVATDFGIAATPSSQSVPAGGVAHFTIDLTGIGGNFNSPVVLTVTGVPSGSTASFSPATLTPGSSATSVLSVATPSLIGELRTPPTVGRSNKLPLLALLLLPLLGLRKARKRMGQWPRAARLLTLGLLACAAMLPLSGCGGGYFGDKPQTVTLTVTGTSSAVQHSTTVTLTIQ